MLQLLSNFEPKFRISLKQHKAGMKIWVAYTKSMDVTNNDGFIYNSVNPLTNKLGQHEITLALKGYTIEA